MRKSDKSACQNKFGKRFLYENELFVGTDNGMLIYDISAGIPELLYNYYPYELSGGQQQKVCLCIALACNPKILIIDEGTSYLDCIAKKEILTLVKALQNEFNFSFIIYLFISE